MDDQWLFRHARNVHSQKGEDGIIEKILEVLGTKQGWCVEFGAWDGEYLSNTYNLIANHGFSAVLIEGSAERVGVMTERFRANAKVIPVHAFVGFTPDDGLDKILAATPIPSDFDVLSIDIDGNDYHAWKAVSRYRPKLVVIEFNPTIPSAVEFVQPADMSINQGSSLLSLSLLAKEKGYELIAATEFNGFFVPNEYFSLFGIKDNSVHAIRPNENLVTYIFNGFDGTVFVRGYGKLGWHGVPYRESRMQLIPRLLRGFPDTQGKAMKRIAKYYRSIKKRI
ncbi:MAG TPA: FkbM family methyltransferase [Burkholderiales bacterium]|nr:FkbM family methyltransferase [Burkholderiales bacterium]